MDGLAADFRFAARRLAATPLFTIFAVLSLAVGVGVTTAVYSVVASIFMKDFGFRDPEQIVFVVTPYEARMMHGSISVPDFHDLRAAQTAFSSLSASSRITAAVTSLTITELLTAEAVDGAYFQTFGVSAARGRVILPEDQRAAARVVVLSHRVWHGRFAADPAIVGQTVRIAGQPFEVVGVAPSSFDGAASGPFRFRTDLWIPLGTEPAIAAPSPTPVNGDERDRRRLQVFGRLSPSATSEKASAELATIAAGLDRAYPGRIKGAPGRPTERPWKARTAAALAREDNSARRFGLTLIGLVALVLVVACTNLANLVLARGTNRYQEFAVRCALGAPRWRLVREQCAESVILAVGGAAAACVVFQVLRVVMDVEYQLPLPMGGQVTLAIQPALDGTVLTIAVVSLLLSLVVFGIEPALQLTRLRDLKDALAAGGGSVGNPKTRRQQTLLRWQVAISAGFFVVATMFVKYSVAEARHDPGVDLERLGVAVLNFHTQRWDEARVRRALERVQSEALKDPIVNAVAVSTGMPFGLRPLRFLLSAPDMPSALGDVSAAGMAATPAIFTTLGVPILRGRGFDDRDHAGAAPVVVISEHTARRVFGTADAIGRTLVLQHVQSRVTATVIGVARDTDVGRVLSEARAFIYVPLAQRYDPYLAISVRSSGAAVATAALRDALRRADPDMAVDMIGTGRSTMAGMFVLLRAFGGTAVALGAVTLMLAMAGLFGIQSHIVAHRTREIGVRMSLGASAGQIKRMMLKDGYRPVFEGLVLGLFGGFVGRVIVRAYLEIDVSVIDPWLLFAVPVPPIVAAFWACYLPARRAAGVDPNVALRQL